MEKTGKIKTTNFARKVILYELIDLAILYNDKNLPTFAQVNYNGNSDCAVVNIQDRVEFTVIASAYMYFGNSVNILATTLYDDFETAKNLLK